MSYPRSSIKSVVSNKAGVTVQKPTLTNIALQVADIGQRYDEEREGVAILQKVKEMLA